MFLKIALGHIQLDIYSVQLQGRLGVRGELASQEHYDWWRLVKSILCGAVLYLVF